jgi:hypothetical protein
MFPTALIQDRMRQLQQEKQVDQIIQQSIIECPHTVTQLLLTMRAYNRHLSHKTYQFPVYQIPSKLSENMKQIQTLQHTIITTNQTHTQQSSDPKNRDRANCDTFHELQTKLQYQIKSETQ